MTWHETCILWWWQIRARVMMHQCSPAYNSMRDYAISSQCKIHLCSSMASSSKVLLIFFHSHNAWTGITFMTWHETCRLWWWQIRVPVMMHQCSAAQLYEGPCHILLIRKPSLCLYPSPALRTQRSIFLLKHAKANVLDPRKLCFSVTGAGKTMAR